MIEEIKNSIDKEIEILREISMFARRMETATIGEKKILIESINSLRKEMKFVNDSIPGFIHAAAPMAEKKVNKEEAKTIQKGTPAKTKSQEIAISKVDNRDDFLKELNITDRVLRKVRRDRAQKEEEIEEFKSARGYLRWSNKMFLGTAGRLIKKNYFGNLPVELKKSNLEILFEAYVAMMLFSAFLSFFAGIVISVLFLLIDFSISKILIAILIPFILPIVVFMALYFYPSTEKNSISKKIDEELPFAVIHMSSISGSGIEPTEIFKIIGLSKDYPYLKKEIRKVLNQINIYGYDLVTALNNVSKSTSNPKLAELFGGLSTTINSGGSLSDFFEKRAETLLINYKLEKEKSIKVAETFMDVYISVVIAAPMILMLMLVMISISGIETPFSTGQMTLMTIGGVALVNILFLGFLQTKST